MHYGIARSLYLQRRWGPEARPLWAWSCVYVFRLPSMERRRLWRTYASCCLQLSTFSKCIICFIMLNQSAQQMASWVTRDEKEDFSRHSLSRHRQKADRFGAGSWASSVLGVVLAQQPGWWVKKTWAEMRWRRMKSKTPKRLNIGFPHETSLISKWNKKKTMMHWYLQSVASF